MSGGGVMRERPILFSGPMVRAILAGTKTQTRRVVKPQPTHFLGGPGVTYSDGSECPLTPCIEHPNKPFSVEIRCHYGQPGDRLWVRETWRGAGADLMYRADDGDGFDGPPHGSRGSDVPWRPSIHMPRAASRITLEITGVRVERLQDISEADAIAEGAPPSHRSIDQISREYGFADFPRSWFGQLWDTINGAGAWDANPWVWVVEFKRVQP